MMMRRGLRFGFGVRVWLKMRPPRKGVDTICTWQADGQSHLAVAMNTSNSYPKKRKRADKS